MYAGERGRRGGTREREEAGGEEAGEEEEEEGEGKKEKKGKGTGGYQKQNFRKV